MIRRHKDELTPMQARFVAEYLADLNATQAAIRAGYGEKGAMVAGSRLLSLDKISKAVAEGKRQQLDKADLTALRVLEEMRRLAFSDLGDLLILKGGRLALRDLKMLTPAQRTAISSIELVMKNTAAGDDVVDRVLKIKLWDKPRVLELLAKHFKLLTEVTEIQASDALLARLTRGRDRLAAAGKL